MNTDVMLAQLTQKGVRFWVNDQNLNIRAPQGVITPEIQAELATHKAEILAFLQKGNMGNQCASVPLSQGLSLHTIGRLIGGFSTEFPEGYKPPVIDPKVMAQNLSVTFRPLPPNYQNQVIIQFRRKLALILKNYGVRVIPWYQAKTEFCYDFRLPIINRNYSIKIKGARSEINAVIDVERPSSYIGKLGTCMAESLYSLYSQLLLQDRKISVLQIAKLSSWAEDYTARYIEDPTNTQVIILKELDQTFINPLLPYQDKISIGINTLVKTFSEIVIGVSDERISILNMNLSDSIFPQGEIEDFVLKSLIPKVFVPIAPLLMNRFAVSKYNPNSSEYAAKLVKLGQELASTGLFPPGFKLSEVIKRKSHRDIVDVIVNGRTGVSYGFVAYAEPPHYVGKIEISASEWESLSSVEGFSSDELRQNQQGRRYIKTIVGGKDVYKQIPDIWLVSSRSGANKTDLNLETDVLRIGLQDKLYLQLPDGMENPVDVKPSYDTYVMLAISLAAALYTPELIKDGAPIVHFHGYPALKWFQENEYCVGVNNPSVPCGTYESGVLNFLGVANLQLGQLKKKSLEVGEPLNQKLSEGLKPLLPLVARGFEDSQEKINLIGLIEPDHGVNFIASNPSYLVERLKSGCGEGDIELGSKHFASLKANLG